MTAPKPTPRTLEAMRRLGVTKEDLIVRHAKDFFLQCKGNAELARKTAAFYQKRRDDMIAMVQTEREEIINPKAESSPPRHQTPTLKCLAPRSSHSPSPSPDNKRRISHVVNQVRRQAAQVLERRTRSVMALNARRDARIQRAHKARDEAAERKRQQNIEIDLAKRSKIEESRAEFLKTLDGQLGHLEKRYQEREAAREETLQRERARLAKERAEEEERRQKAWELKTKSVEDYVADLEEAQANKDKLFEEHKLATEKAASEARREKFLLRDARHKKALEAIVAAQEELTQRRREELQARDVIAAKAKETLVVVVKKHLERRQQSRTEAQERVMAATIAHDKHVEDSRVLQIQKLEERDLLVDERREQKKQEWAEKSLTNYLKSQTYRDNLTRCHSQQLHRMEMRRKEVQEKWRVLEERAEAEAVIRNEDVQRRRARKGPEVNNSALTMTPGPGHYLGTDAPWLTSRKTCISAMVGATLPPYPTPSPQVYSPRPEVTLPYKGAPRM